jgi:hypothetical protein
MAETKRGHVCGTFLGNLEACKDVTIQLPCRLSKRHKTKSHLTEIRQHANGVISWRLVPKGEPTQYHGEIEVRVQNG